MEQEEAKISVSEQTNVGDNSANYIEAIKEMKANTVDRAAYDKLRQENKQLLDAFVNGEQLNNPKPDVPVDVDKIRNELFSGNCDNLGYISNALALRKELMERGEKDPFLPYGKNVLPNDDDIAKAEKVANVLQECVDIADGNSDIFTNELQRRLVDPILPRRAR